MTDLTGLRRYVPTLIGGEYIGVDMVEHAQGAYVDVNELLPWLSAHAPRQGMTELHQAAQAALEWIDFTYPPNVFGDLKLADDIDRIVAIRENLRAALAAHPAPAPPTNPTAYGTGDLSVDEDSAVATMIASEPVLAKDWDTPADDAAYAHLAEPPTPDALREAAYKALLMLKQLVPDATPEELRTDLQVYAIISVQEQLREALGDYQPNIPPVDDAPPTPQPAVWRPLPDGPIEDATWPMWVQDSGRELKCAMPDGNTVYISLPTGKRLCELVAPGVEALPEPTPCEPEPLDAPDGPGWWAFEGQVNIGDHDNGDKWSHAATMISVDELGCYWRAGDKWHYDTNDFRGKWTRVYMPWELRRRPGAQETQP